MARTPTVYRWDDPGAPDLNAIMPTANDKILLFMHTVLKACLVDGYGTKAAAGWTMPHEEFTSNGCRFVLRNSAGSGSLLYEGGMFSGGGNDLKATAVWACSAVPSMDSPINAWSYKTKYEDRDTVSGADFHKAGTFDVSASDGWVVVANENTVIFITGKSGVDFNASSSSAPAAANSGVLIFGVMHDGLGGVANPEIGDFYIAGGVGGSYTGYSWYAGIGAAFTSTVGITGLAKEGVHGYSYKKPQLERTYSPLSAWLPIPMVYMQYGASAPDGDSATRLHFSAMLPGIRKLILHPYNAASLNEFMNNNAFEYGKSFSYLGGQWVVFKALDDVVQVISLAPAEWGA